MDALFTIRMLDTAIFRFLVLFVSVCVVYILLNYVYVRHLFQMQTKRLFVYGLILM